MAGHRRGDATGLARPLIHIWVEWFALGLNRLSVRDRLICVNRRPRWLGPLAALLTFEVASVLGLRWGLKWSFSARVVLLHETLLFNLFVNRCTARALLCNSIAHDLLI